MALTLTVGTNTYISLADAETYVEGTYGPRRDAWDADAATDAIKNTLLVQATRDIDALMWRGEKSESDQALEFPRDGEDTDDDSYDLVEAACVEQAMWLLAYNNERREAIAGQGVRAVSVGGVSETYGGGTTPRLCQRARELLRDWLIIGAAFV